MTATPLRKDNRDTYRYFGNPLYTYSLKQGIDDGFLAPYRVHRILTTFDAAGWRPNKGQQDVYGRHIPEFLKKTDRHAKAIVFCVDQEHADQMRRALNNLNADLVKQLPPGEDYVARVT